MKSQHDLHSLETISALSIRARLSIKKLEQFCQGFFQNKRRKTEQSRIFFL